MESCNSKLNATLTMTIGLLLALGATSALAGERDSYLDACRSEVQQQYGTDTDVMVVSKRRIPSGVQVKLAARMDRDNTEFLNCWVPSNEDGNGGYARGFNALAATVQPADSALPR